MKEIKLKPCPFCGGEAYLGESWDQTKTIQCSICGCGTLHMKNKLDVIEIWNRRAVPEKSEKIKTSLA